LGAAYFAPFNEQAPNLSGLGPESWDMGTGVRVRRLRNPGVVTAEEATQKFSALVTRQGSIASTLNINIGGLPALRHELATINGWAASMSVVVAGEFTYFIETGCVPAKVGSCEGVQGVVHALQITS
jgi:hypothetical protein